MNEIEWRDVVGYEGFYQVSRCGKIKSLDRVVISQHRKTKKNGKILKTPLYFGYPKVQLRRKSTFVHRIVANAFLVKPES